MARKVGTWTEVLIDEVDEDGAIDRSSADAPEIDGNDFINGPEADALQPGDLVQVEVEAAEDYDLWGSVVAKNYSPAQLRQPMPLERTRHLQTAPHHAAH